MLSNKFRCKDLGEARSILGYEILRDRKHSTLDLRQRGRINEYLAAFHMADSKPIQTPMVAGLTLPRPEETSTEDHKLLYCRLVACLLYLGQVARPDILYAAHYLLSFVNAYSLKHWTAVKHVLQYLCGTQDYTIRYRRARCASTQVKSTFPTFYADVDWAGDISDRHSTSAYFVIYSGAPVAWSCAKQGAIATSTTEVELNAIHYCVDQFWISFLGQGFGYLCQQNNLSLILIRKSVNDGEDHWMEYPVHGCHYKIDRLVHPSVFPSLT